MFNVINYKLFKMKKLLFGILTIASINISFSQNTDRHYFRMHYVDVTGNVGEFIKANREYFKPLAIDAVKENTWAGWTMLRSVTESSKFIFVHHFSNSEQVANIHNNFGLIFNNKRAKELDLTAPDWSKFSMSSDKSYEIWERNGQVGDGKNTNFFIINNFKFNNKKKFIENNRLWGSLVVKPQLEKTKGLSWGCATILSSSSGEDGKMKSFNGMSWDGYNSLSEILNNFSYNEDNSWDNKYFKTFMKEIKDKDLTKFANAKHSEIYELIDSSFN